MISVLTNQRPVLPERCLVLLVVVRFPLCRCSLAADNPRKHRGTSEPTLGRGLDLLLQLAPLRLDCPLPLLDLDDPLHLGVLVDGDPLRVGRGVD